MKQILSLLILLDCQGYLPFLVGPTNALLIAEHETPYVRETTAKALSVALPAQAELFSDYLDKLMTLYEEKVHNTKNMKLMRRQNQFHRSTINTECLSKLRRIL